MAWELLKVTGKIGLVVGRFAVKTITNSIILPESLRGENYNWYFDPKTQIAKVQIETNGIRNAKKSISVPNAVKDAFKDEQAVVYMADNSLYLCSYKKGQEYLESALRKEGII
jgi:hypothetical protein